MLTAGAVQTIFGSNTWIQLVWTLERVGNQVHHITVSVADQTYPLDTDYTTQPNWFQEGIDVAFQMDGNYAQQPLRRMARRSESLRELTSG
jgi:hypothetical protein